MSWEAAIVIFLIPSYIAAESSTRSLSGWVKAEVECSGSVALNTVYCIRESIAAGFDWHFQSFAFGIRLSHMLRRGCVCACVHISVIQNSRIYFVYKSFFWFLVKSHESNACNCDDYFSPYLITCCCNLQHKKPQNPAAGSELEFPRFIALFGPRQE